MRKNIAINDDCMNITPMYKDGHFDLAVVDPPFGIGQNWRKDRSGTFYNHDNKFNDSIPDEAFFKELFRVSKHQIIFGCNYYWNFLPPSNNLIFWDKGKNAMTQFGSAGELAWTSITKYPLNKVYLAWHGFIRCEKTSKIHPHQKPVKLYDWIFTHYAEAGWKILDTHLGSGSSRISAYKFNFDFLGIEKDQTYFQDQEHRFNDFISQCVLDFESLNQEARM